MLFFLVSFFLMATQQASAAACCGGGFALPSLITGDDKAQLTGSFGRSEINQDVNENGIWSGRQTPETTEFFRIEGAHIFEDRWQSGFSLPVLRRSRGIESSRGLGDVVGNVGYEVLPDWDYNPWRPKGVGFLSLRVPTAPTVNESESDWGLEARGLGFWGIGTGLVLTKVIRRWDLLTSLELHRSFAKKISNSRLQAIVEPGFGGNSAVSVGYNWPKTRAGLGLSLDYEDPIRSSGSISSDGTLRRWATASLSVSQLFEDGWAGTFTYSDQTLFGAPINTALTKSFSIYFQKRWSR